MHRLPTYPFRRIPMTSHTVKRIFCATKRWVIQGGVLVPFTATSPAHAITSHLHTHFRELAARVIISIYSAKGDRCYWVYDEDEFIRKGYWCFRHPRYITRAYHQWRRDVQAYYRFLGRLERRGIQRLSHDFEKFYSLYLREYSIPLCTEYYSLGGDDLVRRLLVKYGATAEVQQWIEVLTRPPELSFLQRSELACLRIALRLAKQKTTIHTIQQLRRRFPNVSLLLQKVQRDFFWIHNSYRDTKPLTQQFFFVKVMRLINKYDSASIQQQIRLLEQYPHRIRSEQKMILQNVRLTRREIEWLQGVGFAASWQDDRKQANLLGNYWGNAFLQVASKKLSWPFASLQFILPQELIVLLSGATPVTQLEAEKRMKASFYAVFPTGEESFVAGKQARQLMRRVLSANVPSSGAKIQGIGAAVGIYRGKVRKIESPSADGHKLRPGDILMTYMTRPDFVPLMHRAGAIVTDEGGLTSHAAIISREMKIPCVVGTRFAMRIFKDGDFVEVNGATGTIKKVTS